MLFETGIILIIVAGLINASFIIPIKYVKNFSNEKIWLVHSLSGVAILPWLLLNIVSSNALNNYTLLQTNDWVILLAGGLIFGLGQLCFAYAIEKIGIGLCFTINLSIGITIGSLFVLNYRNAFFTVQGLWVVIATVLILGGLVINYVADRINQVGAIDNRFKYKVGWLLAIFAGIASGLQNVSFITVAYHYSSTDSYWVWPPFLLAASLPMVIGFWYRMNQHTDLQAVGSACIQIVKNLLFIAFMGFCFTGSLALYSAGMNYLTLQQQILGWPALMVSIILTSQFWSWLYGETTAFDKQQRVYRLCSISLLILAIIILAIK